jgi:hypothetical protein
LSSIRDRIAAVKDSKAEKITVPEWDDVVLEVRSITVKQHSDLIAAAAVDGETVDLAVLIPRLLIMSVYDPENGEPAFCDADAEWLAGLGAGVVERLGLAAMRVSGIDEGAVEAGKGGS